MYQSLYNNNAIGYKAMFSNTSGNNNIAYGSNNLIIGNNFFVSDSAVSNTISIIPIIIVFVQIQLLLVIIF